CCAGDLFEQDRYTPDSAAFLRRVFADLHPIPVLLAPGNHDWYGPASLYQQVDWTDNVHVFTEPALRPYVLDDGLTMLGAALCSAREHLNSKARRACTSKSTGPTTCTSLRRPRYFRTCRPTA